MQFNNLCFIAIPSWNRAWISINFEYFNKKPSQQSAFYKNNFFLSNQNAWLKGPNFQEIKFNEFKNLFINLNSKKPNFNWEIRNKNLYKKQFQSLQNHFKLGNLTKGVPFYHEKCNFNLENEHIFYFIQSLLKKNLNHNYLYGYWNKETSEGYIGATPELIFVQHENNLKTIALAGTIKNSNEKSDFSKKNNNLINLKINTKIQDEHNVVIHGMLQELNKFGTIKLQKTELIKLKNFSHLKSKISINLNSEFNFETLLNAIHPTPALGAFPKQFGMNWLQEIENKFEKRLQYCSPFGVTLNSNFSLCIGLIRGIQWNKQNVCISAGGGVIPESTFEEEWDEIQLKISAIKDFLGI